MKQKSKANWIHLPNACQLIQNMGLRYAVFMIWHAFQKRSGILRLRFPVSPPGKKFISLAEWQKQPVRFFFQDPVRPLPLDINHAGYGVLAKRIKAFHRRKPGCHGFKCSDSSDWLRNPDSGFLYTPTEHWTKIPVLSPEAGDIKLVWEKSRFTFLYELIRYDFHFGRDHSQIVLAEIESWIKENPVNCGPNWCCSQEITLRVLNWTFALQYYKRSPALTEPVFARIINSIYQQMRHVAGHIQFSRIAVRNNHALTESLGLYLVGVLYPFFEESRIWKKNGKKWFEEEVAYQIYEDGTFLQFSMNYHRVAVQLFTWAIQIAHLNQERWHEVVYDRARKSLFYLQACQDGKSGQLPNYGNNDGALFFPLSDCHFRDYRPQLLALAHVLGEKSGYGAGPWTEESAWLGISQPEESKAVSEDSRTCVFPKSGYYVLRDNKTITFLRCGNYQDRPSQSDHLHLDLWVDGENILRDAGSYKYNTDQKWTRYFSGTASHNTVMLGDFSQMRRGPRFIWYDWIKKSEAGWRKENDQFIFEGWFEGFKELGKNIIHRRRVSKPVGALRWTIEDWIENAPGPPILMHQIWHPSNTFFEKFTIKATLQGGQQVPFAKTEGWYSSLYGRKESAHRIVFSSAERYIKTEISIKS